MGLKQPLLALLCAVVAALCGPRQGHARGRDGHRIVCAIAWDELTPRARQRVHFILEVDTKEQFADLCNWADNYRTQHPWTADWHFINVHPGDTSVNMERDCPAAQSCVVEQIAVTRRAIARRDPWIDRAASLQFLGHFVGDVHQPLHVAFREDRGGNDIKGTFFGKQTNLQAVWETGIIEHDGRPWQQIAADLEKSVTPAERKEWGASPPIVWANESLAITLAPTTQYIDHEEPFTLGEDYERHNLPVVLQRLKQAGVRLAGTLNSVLK